jgi:hypothetical protein
LKLRREGDYDLPAVGRDPKEEYLQSLNNPFQVMFIFTRILQKASFLRALVKINNPADAGFVKTLRREGDYDLPAVGRDSKEEYLQSLNNPFRVMFIFTRILQKASFLRALVKINNPADAGFVKTLRREGDSNPRFAGRRTTVFETAAFDHSAISPIHLSVFAIPHSRTISLFA